MSMKTTLPAFTIAILLFAGCKSATFFETPNHLGNITGTLYLENGRKVDGKLMIDMGFSPRNAVRIIPSGEKESMKFSLSEIDGYETRGTYYALKEIRNSISVGKNYSFMKRLTPANSRIHLYENIEKEVRTRSYRRYNSGTSTTYEADYYMQFPDDRRDAVWALSSSKFTPNFDEKMSKLVADCPALASKIARKEEPYFYRQVSSTEKRAEVLLTIISEYNNCR
jgi:hypothetical protein